MANFDPAYLILAQNEGGYSYNPLDKGGETYCGISRKYFPKWPGWTTIDQHNLKHGDILPELEPLVKSFYKTNFWDKIYCELFTSQKISTFVFDWYVNSGKYALKALQRAVGVTVDGIVGGATVAAANMRNENDLMLTLIMARKQFYKDIVSSDKSQEVFLNGWLRRVDGLA